MNVTKILKCKHDLLSPMKVSFFSEGSFVWQLCLKCSAIIPIKTDAEIIPPKETVNYYSREWRIGNGTPGDWSENTTADLAYTQAEENTDHNFY